MLLFTLVAAYFTVALVNAACHRHRCTVKFTPALPYAEQPDNCDDLPDWTNKCKVNQVRYDQTLKAVLDYFNAGDDNRIKGIANADLSDWDPENPLTFHKDSPHWEGQVRVWRSRYWINDIPRNFFEEKKQPWGHQSDTLRRITCEWEDEVSC